eukprot:15409544-Alexandrium_andersonii.AAC.1
MSAALGEARRVGTAWAALFGGAPTEQLSGCSLDLRWVLRCASLSLYAHHHHTSGAMRLPANLG